MVQKTALHFLMQLWQQHEAECLSPTPKRSHMDEDSQSTVRCRFCSHLGTDRFKVEKSDQKCCAVINHNNTSGNNRKKHVPISMNFLKFMVINPMLFLLPFKFPAIYKRDYSKFLAICKRNCSKR